MTSVGGRNTTKSLKNAGKRYEKMKFSDGKIEMSANSWAYKLIFHTSDYGTVPTNVFDYALAVGWRLVLGGILLLIFLIGWDFMLIGEPRHPSFIEFMSVGVAVVETIVLFAVGAVFGYNQLSKWWARVKENSPTIRWTAEKKERK